MFFVGFFAANWSISNCVCFVLSQIFKSKLLESGGCVLTRALCILLKLDQTAYLCSTEQHTVHRVLTITEKASNSVWEDSDTAEKGTLCLTTDQGERKPKILPSSCCLCHSSVACPKGTATLVPSNTSPGLRRGAAA